VLVDFWTYTCINWRRTLPQLRALAAKYEEAGLVVLGVHTPEFSFEGHDASVREQVAELAIRYPVALDSGYAIREGPEVGTSDRIRSPHPAPSVAPAVRALSDRGGARLPSRTREQP
jgi:thiol-disulfide isomerase/thioredoxin